MAVGGLIAAIWTILVALLRRLEISPEGIGSAFNPFVTSDILDADTDSEPVPGTVVAAHRHQLISHLTT
jgi:hypothetical protein